MVIVDSSMDNEDIVAEINAEIDTLRSYGRRIETPSGKKPWRRVAWSNGSSEWWQYFDSMRGPGDLDSNEFGVIGISKTRLEPLLIELDALPLGRGSFEARRRGVFSFEGNEIPPAIKAIMLEEGVVDIQTQIALEDKFKEN